MLGNLTPGAQFSLFDDKINYFKGTPPNTGVLE